MKALRVRATIALTVIALAAGCGSRPPTRPEPPPRALTEEQRRELESRRHHLRQELLALEALPEIQRAMGSAASLEEAQISLSERQGDTIAQYFRLKAQLDYIEQLLR